VAILSSAAVLTAETDYVQATRPAKLLTGTADAEGAAALAEAARRRLRLLGVGDDVVGQLERGIEPSITFALTAPFAGSVVQSSAPMGAAVEAGTSIFRLEDLSVIDVIARLPERALSSITIGQRAMVRVPAYPDTTFAGRVERLKDVFDSETRTIPTVIRVANAGHRLRPGMFATVSLGVHPNEAGGIADRGANCEGVEAMIDRIVQWAIGHRMAVALGLLAVIGTGLWTLCTLRVDAFPDLTDGQVPVLVEAPRLSPVEVELLVTFPAEVALHGIPQVQHIRSISKCAFAA
jgi:hypothetical protein